MIFIVRPSWKFNVEYKTISNAFIQHGKMKNAFPMNHVLQCTLPVHSIVYNV